MDGCQLDVLALLSQYFTLVLFIHVFCCKLKLSIACVLAYGLYFVIIGLILSVDRWSRIWTIFYLKKRLISRLGPSLVKQIESNYLTWLLQPMQPSHIIAFSKIYVVLSYDWSLGYLAHAMEIERCRQQCHTTRVCSVESESTCVWELIYNFFNFLLAHAVLFPIKIGTVPYRKPKSTRQSVCFM
jgi:hypothetical protein